MYLHGEGKDGFAGTVRKTNGQNAERKWGEKNALNYFSWVMKMEIFLTQIYELTIKNIIFWQKCQWNIM